MTTTRANRQDAESRGRHGPLVDVSRRDFLRSTGLLVVSFRLGGVGNAAGVRSQSARVNAAPRRPDPAIDRVDSYLMIDKESRVILSTGRIDMGTGNGTCFLQFVADELDVALGQIRLVAGDTEVTPDGGKTTASNGVSIGSQPLRVSAATARHKLLELASERLGVAADQLAVNDGIVSVKEDPSKQVSYGALIGDQGFNITLEIDEVTVNGPLMKIPAGVTLKTASQKKYVGTSVPRVDLPDRILNGTFCQNVRLPGMLHGRCVRPESLGATVVSVDERSIADLPGLVKVVVQRNFVGVVCQREEQAIQAQRRLHVVWSKGSGLPGSENVFEAVRRQPTDARIPEPHPTSRQGDVDAAMTRAAKILKATYEYPWNHHAMLGPTCGVADVRTDGVTIWSGSQWPRYTQKDVAYLLGRPTESVRVVCVPESGSYGRLGAADAAADAALLSEAVGKPVRVQWSRHEEQAWSPLQPAFVADVRGALDVQGNVIAWEAETWSSSFQDTGRGGGLLAMRLVGRDPGPRNPIAATASAISVDYVFPNVRSAAHTVEPLFRAIFMRAPAAIQRYFVIESFMDELAAAAGADPLDFRLRYMRPGVNVDLLRRVRKSSGWDARPSSRLRARYGRVVTGRGYGQGEGAHTVVEVEVDRQTGKVRIREVWVAYSPGPVVNPDGLVNQLEQATLQGLSRALLEEVKFDRSHITTTDWVSHPIMRFSDVPKVHVEIVDRPDLPLNGAGEMGSMPVAGAVANAIFDATGVRIRRVPFTPARVLAALKA
jgi:CO/xanthine dehydrogenase Mo-binding subunit